MVQPNKADFVVREVLKRMKVSRDRMALPGHSECCISRSKREHRTIFVRLFPAEDDIAIENFKGSATLLRNEF
jgi:hypothetical protein